MVKKISLDLPDESYEELASLGEFYNKDVKQVISDILNAVSMDAHHVISLAKEYKAQMELDRTILFMLDAGWDAIYLIFNTILEQLGVKGLYTFDDCGYNVDEHDLWFHCICLQGCNLQIDDFFIHLDSGGPSLSAYSYVEAEKISSEKLEKLKNRIKQIELPEHEEFADIDGYDLYINENEDQVTLQIELSADSLHYLPGIKGISKFANQIFRKAGIK